MLGLLAMIIGAPHAMAMRYTVLEFDPYLLNILRSLLAAIACTPILLQHRKLFLGKALREANFVAVTITIASICFLLGLLHSSASFVSMLILLTPIVLVVYSARYFGEKINKRATAGIVLAAAGALVLVLLPIAMEQQATFQFYPLATALIVQNSLIYPLSVIKITKLDHEYHVPLLAIIGYSSWVIAGVNSVIWALHGAPLPASVSWQAVMGVVYSGIVVTVFSRALSIWAYERIGSVAIGALTYLESLLAVVLPIIILGEKLSLEMVIGGAMIMLGVYVIEYHKSTHAKRHHFSRHH